MHQTFPLDRNYSAGCKVTAFPLFKLLYISVHSQSPWCWSHLLGFLLVFPNQNIPSSDSSTSPCCLDALYSAAPFQKPTHRKLKLLAGVCPSIYLCIHREGRTEASVSLNSIRDAHSPSPTKKWRRLPFSCHACSSLQLSLNKFLPRLNEPQGQHCCSHPDRSGGIPLSRIAVLNPLLTLTQSCLLCPEATAAQTRD